MFLSANVSEGLVFGEIAEWDRNQRLLSQRPEAHTARGEEKRRLELEFLQRIFVGCNANHFIDSLSHTDLSSVARCYQWWLL